MLFNIIYSTTAKTQIPNISKIEIDVKIEINHPIKMNIIEPNILDLCDFLLVSIFMFSCISYCSVK